MFYYLFLYIMNDIELEVAPELSEAGVDATPVQAEESEETTEEVKPY